MIRTLGLGLVSLVAALVALQWEPALPAGPNEPAAVRAVRPVPETAAVLSSSAADALAPTESSSRIAVDETPPPGPGVLAEVPVGAQAPEQAAAGFIEVTLTDRGDWEFDEGAAADVVAPMQRKPSASEPSFEGVESDEVAQRAPLDPDRSAKLIRRLLMLYQKVGAPDR